MLFGMYRLPPSKKRAQVGYYLIQRVKGVLSILPFDEDAGRWQAEQRARLTAVGKTPSYVDSPIAAIAVINGLALVTRNTQDFADFKDLGLENWLKE